MTTLEKCPLCKSTELSDLIQVAAQMHPSDEQFQFQQCGHCSLVFLNPRVHPEQLKEYYTEYYLPYRGPAAWGKYENRVADSQKKLDAKRANLLQDYVCISKDTLILDVGCGQPSFLQACYEKYNCKTLGVDFSDEGWKSKSSDFSNLDLMIGVVSDLPKGLRPDVITMWHYLEHDYDPLTTLKQLKTIAKEDTKLIIEVPNYNSESRKKYGKDWAGFHVPRHTFLFSPNTLQLLLTASGWNPLDVRLNGTLDPYVLYWMSEMERKGIAWDKNMETEFWGYVSGMLRFTPTRMFSKGKSLGVMIGVGGVQF